ncbi:NAD(P)-binding domain-containing protein [Rathayibacter sp. ZW T2_19]|uniref:NAD(P)-binding domain-containing protein n=1 Tax=Rathayibacter rubneri TaxID=2950106 RepID=A0A9X2DXD4_9MICO|nr:NAD(P)-binding domain-containing protein [Rathayibacter rubneri]MCM6762885.1 NAD(P)-binding domain-containing protein [Rathayibacter rubneri]
MKRIGIIGSGDIGSGIARLTVAAGHEVLIANSRGPESLRDLIDELGPQARAGDALEAAEFGDITVLAVPLAAYEALPEGALAGRTVLSTGNYYPHRDGRIDRLDALELTTAELEQELLPGAVISKAFNNIVAHHIPTLAGSSPRTALAVFGDDDQGKAAVSALVDDLGFEPVDAGTLAESWRTEPESGAYTRLYAADPEGFAKDYLADRGAPVPADRLRDLIAASHRADVAARTF